MTTSLRFTHSWLPRLDRDLIDEAPRPIFARLEWTDDRVPSPFGMCRGVSVGRRVAATDMAARQAHSEMDPRRADQEAVFASIGRRRDVKHLIEVAAHKHQLVVDALILAPVGWAIWRLVVPLRWQPRSARRFHEH